MSACSGAAGREVAVDVGTAKTVDRLLGVTDQQQCSVLPVLGCAVDAVKDAKLQRRSVLELVDECHGKLLAQSLGQSLTRFGVGQGHIQALQHVGKPKLATAALELGHALQHMGTGVQTGGLRGFGQGLKPGQELRIGLAFGRQINHIALLATFQQAFGREAVPAFAHRVFQRFQIAIALSPQLERIEPLLTATQLQQRAVPAMLFGRQLRLNPTHQEVSLLDPTLLEGRELRFALGQRRAKHLGQRADFAIGQGHCHESRHVFVECGHIAPNMQHLGHQRHGHGVELLAPIVLHSLETQPGFVTHQVFFK